MIRRSSRGNDNHWPKGTPGGKGGQFAPKGKGVAISNSGNYYETKTLFRSGYISQAEFDKMTQKPTFTPAKTIKEAEDYCRSLGIEPYYKGLSLDTCNAINESVSYTLANFPKTKAYINVVGNAQEINKTKKAEIENAVMENMWMTKDGRQVSLNRKRAKSMASRAVGRVSSRTWAYTYMSEPTGRYAEVKKKYLGIYVNSKYDDFNVSAKHCVETGYHPHCCDSVKSIIDHECGHLIHASYGGMAINMKDPSIGEELSIYAKTNVKEYHAEAWAEFLNNPKPRPRAKEIGELFMRKAKL